MERGVSVGGVVVALGLAAGLAFAALESPPVPPKGIEGPDVRLVASVQPKGSEGPDVRDIFPPTDIEGPNGR
jgi:hypothetical protein